MFNKIKGYYDGGLWDVQRVFNVVSKGVITEAEYRDITGFVYPAIS